MAQGAGRMTCLFRVLVAVVITASLWLVVITWRAGHRDRNEGGKVT